jgi:hypothetical protein
MPQAIHCGQLDRTELPVDKHLAGCDAPDSVVDMATSQDLERRVSQNTNDIVALYDLQRETNETVMKIAEVQQEHGRRLDTMDGRLDSHGEKLDEILGILRPT